ncbi:MAG: hypothetical protein NDI90_01785 [Nitrospira sp. BO4]|nr:hypothetical protein [Nitrospira sp. BO4]
MAPLQATPSSTTIPRSLQALVKPISTEGADHRPGITMLEWPNRDVSQAIFGFLQQRATFTSVSSDPADLTLVIATKLSLSSRQNLYHYRISLQAEMSKAAKPMKSYLVEQTAVGSSVRWVTASDRAPIAAALQLALEDLMGKIEADRLLYIDPTERP